MSASYTIESATPADVPVLLSFVRELAEHEKRLHEVSATEEGLRASLFAQPPVAHALMARMGGQAAGYAVYYFSHSTFQARRCLFLEDLFVKLQFRGHHLGSALFKRCAEIAHSAHCAYIEWNVVRDNRLSQDFYERMGAVYLPDMQMMRLPPQALANLLK